MRVGSIMESKDATFFESEFPMNGNAPSTSGHESSVSPDTFVQIEQTTIVDPEKDDNGVTQNRVHSDPSRHEDSDHQT